MPPRAPRACSTPRCGGVTTSGGKCPRCRAAARRASDEQRGNATRRGYGREHRDRFRLGVLDRDRVCVLCGIAPATVADHHPLSRRQIVDYGGDPNDPSFGRGLCAECDKRQTAQRQPGGWHRTQREQHPMTEQTHQSPAGEPVTTPENVPVAGEPAPAGVEPAETDERHDDGDQADGDAVPAGA